MAVEGNVGNGGNAIRAVMLFKNAEKYGM